MKTKFLICAVILVFIFSCDGKVKDNFPGTYPDCLQPELDSLLTKPPMTPRARLEKYYHNDQYVYFMPHKRHAAGAYVVPNENCAPFCVFGGFLPSDCDGWDKNAEFIEVVWEDPR